MILPLLQWQIPKTCVLVLRDCHCYSGRYLRLVLRGPGVLRRALRCESAVLRCKSARVLRCKSARVQFGVRVPARESREDTRTGG